MAEPAAVGGPAGLPTGKRARERYERSGDEESAASASIRASRA